MTFKYEQPTLIADGLEGSAGLSAAISGFLEGYDPKHSHKDDDLMNSLGLGGFSLALNFGSEAAGEAIKEMQKSPVVRAAEGSGSSIVRDFANEAAKSPLARATEGTASSVVAGLGAEAAKSPLTRETEAKLSAIASRLGEEATKSPAVRAAERIGHDLSSFLGKSSAVQFGEGLLNGVSDSIAQPGAIDSVRSLLRSFGTSVADTAHDYRVHPLHYFTPEDFFHRLKIMEKEGEAISGSGKVLSRGTIKVMQRLFDLGNRGVHPEMPKVDPSRDWNDWQ